MFPIALNYLFKFSPRVGVGRSLYILEFELIWQF